MHTVTATSLPASASENPSHLQPLLLPQVVAHVDTTTSIDLPILFALAQAHKIIATSSNESVASVEISTDNAQMTIHGHKVGYTNVTVSMTDFTYQSIMTSFLVHVKSKPRIALPIADINNMNVNTKRRVKLTPVFRDADGDTLSYSATSSDTSVVSVTVRHNRKRNRKYYNRVTRNDHRTHNNKNFQFLQVRAVGSGTATVTVVAQDNNNNRLSDTFQVVVAHNPHIQTNPHDQTSRYTDSRTRHTQTTQTLREQTPQRGTTRPKQTQTQPVSPQQQHIQQLQKQPQLQPQTQLRQTPRTPTTATQTQSQEQRIQQLSTPRILVSNFGQPPRPGPNDWSTNMIVQSQKFTTGDTAKTLTSIEVSIGENLNASSHVPTVRAELWSDSGNGPDTKLVSLTVPSEINSGKVAFTAPEGTTLTSNTSYYFVIYTTGRVDLKLVTAFSNTHDSSSIPGWSLGDASSAYYIFGANTPSGGQFTIVDIGWGVMQLQVNGF